jgi:hypothetical protein
LSGDRQWSAELTEGVNDGVGMSARPGVRIVEGKRRRHAAMPTRLEFLDRPAPNTGVDSGPGDEHNGAVTADVRADTS